jgi:hypothetical protein
LEVGLLALTGDWEGSWNGLKDVVAEFADNVVKTLTELIPKVKEAIAALYKELVQLVSSEGGDSLTNNARQGGGPPVASTSATVAQPTATPISGIVRDNFMGEWIVIEITEHMDSLVNVVDDGLRRAAESYEGMAEATAIAAKKIELQNNIIRDSILEVSQVSENSYMEAAYGDDLVTPTEEVRKAREELEKLGEAYAKVDETIADLVLENDMLEASLEGGARAAEEVRLASETMKDSQRDLILMEFDRTQGLEAEAEAMKELAEQQDRISEDMEELTGLIYLQNIELTLGGTAAREAALQMEGYTPALAAARTEMEETAARQKELSDAIYDSLSGADSWKEVWNDFSGWLEDWLRDIIARFATQKIMLYFGSDINAVMSSVQSIFSGGFSGSLAAGSTATTATSGISSANIAGGAGAAAGGFALGPLLAYTAAFVVLDKALETSGQFVDNLNAQFNSFTVVVRDGVITGVDAATSSINTFASGMGATLNDYFVDFNTTLVNQATILGVEGAGAIQEGFESAVAFIAGDKAGEEELQRWIEETTAAAYSNAFDQLEPVLQDYISKGLDPLTASAEEWGETLGRMSIATVVVTAAYDLLGLSLDLNGKNVVIFSDQLIESAGGIEAFTTLIDSYYTNFFTKEEQKSAVLAAAVEEVDAMNSMLNDLGIESVTTKEEFRTLTDSLMESGEGTEALTISMLETNDAFALVAEEAANADAQWKTLNDTMILLGFAFESGTPKADAMRLAIEELDGGMDTFSQSIQTYMEVVYSADELSAISAAQAGQNAIDISASMGLTGDAVIDTKEELNALGDEIAAGLTPATVGGINILGELSGSVGVLEEAGVTAAEAVDSLAPSLQGGFELISGSADQTAELMSVAAASMVIAADAMSRAAGGAGVDIEILAAATDILAIETLGSLENAVVDATVVTDIFITGTGNATQSVSTLDLAIVAADGTMVNFEGAIANADGTVTLLDGKIVALDEKIVSLDGAVINADGSLTALDGTIFNLDGIVVAADGSVKSLDGAIFDLDGTIVSADGSVISLAGAVIDADGNIRTLDGTVVDLSGSVGSLAGSASTADGNVDGLTGTVGSLGSTASSVVGDLLKEIGSLESAANSVSKAIGGADIVDGQFTFDAAGSFATGLDYVPYDNFPANLHKGEMVVPANDATFLRGAGMSNNNAAQLDRIAGLLEETRSDNAQLANVNVQIMNDIAVSNRVSADTLKEVKRVNDRILRKTGEAA